MGKWQRGSIIQASQFTKNNSAPLDDRDVVEIKADLINSAVWAVSGTDTRYRGMIVYVREEQKHYTLTTDDTSQWNLDTYAAWRAVGGSVSSVRVQGSGVINSSDSTEKTDSLNTTISINKADNYKVLVAHGTASGADEPDFQLLTGNSFSPTNPHKVLIGANSGSSSSTAAPSFRYIEGTDLPRPTTTSIGAVKIYGTKDLTDITVNTTPSTDADSNSFYGVELATDSDKAFVYVPKQTVSVSGTGNTIVGSLQDGNTITLTKGNRLTGVSSTITGDGNAITGLGVDTNTQEITITKGTTFVTGVSESGTGNTIVSSSQNGAAVTLTKGNRLTGISSRHAGAGNVITELGVDTSTQVITITKGITVGEGKFKIQSNSDSAVNTNFTANSADDTVGVKFVNGGNITVTAAASTSSAPATVTLGVASGYSIPSVEKQTEWDSMTDTKNTAGSQASDNLIYLVGVETKATSSSDDDKQSYTHGNNYIGTDGWLYTDSQKVLVDADLNAIRQALASMEEWPTLTKSANVVPTITTKVETEAVPNLITTYYKLGSTVLGTNNSVQVAGGALTMAKAVSIATTTTFTPSIDMGYEIKNEISGMDYGYKTSLSDTTKSSDTTRTTTVIVTPTHTRTNKSSEATFIVKKQVNGGSWTDAATGTSSNGTITIDISTNLGTLEEGTTKLKLVYTNTSTIERKQESYTVPAVGNTYYSSNINNFDSTHVSSIPAQPGILPIVSKKYANGSTNGVKESSIFTIYGVYPLYTNGSRNQSSAITGDNRTNGTTGGATTYNRFGSSDVAGPNYAANATSTWYVSFGEINISNASLNKAYIYTPAVTGGRSVTITSVQGANSSTGSYDSGTVNMTIVNDGPVTYSGRTYTRWWIQNPAGSEGANSYKITITATNE